MSTWKQTKFTEKIKFLNFFEQLIGVIPMICQFGNTVPKGPKSICKQSDQPSYTLRKHKSSWAKCSVYKPT